MFGDILTEAPELAHNFMSYLYTCIVNYLKLPELAHNFMSYLYLYRKLFEVAGAGLQFYVLLVPLS